MKKTLFLVLTVMLTSVMVGCGKESSKSNSNSISSSLVHVHSLIHFEKIDATCTEDGFKEYYKCSTCNKMFSDGLGENEIFQTPVIEHKGHDFGNWNYDETLKQHKRVCKNDNSHVEKEDCVFGNYKLDEMPTLFSTGKATQECEKCKHEKEIIVPALNDNEVWTLVSGKELCEETSTLKYTSIYGEVSIDVDPIGHNYKTPTYEWIKEDTGYRCVAKTICSRDESHIEIEEGQVTYQEVKEPTYIEEGKGIYTAEFNKEMFTKQEKEISIPKKTEVKVTFDYNIEGKENKVVVGKYGEVITSEKAHKGLCGLEGWYLGEEKYDFTKPVTGDMTLVAHYLDCFENFENGLGIFVGKASGAHEFKIVEENGNHAAMLECTSGIDGQIAINNLNGYDFSEVNYMVFDAKVTNPTTAGAIIVQVMSGENKYNYTKSFSEKYNAYENIEKIVVPFNRLIGTDTLDKTTITGISIFMQYKGQLTIDNVTFLNEYNANYEEGIIPCVSFENKTVSEVQSLYSVNQTLITKVDETTGAFTFKNTGGSQGTYKKLQSKTYEANAKYDLTKYYAIELKINSKDGAAKFKFEVLLQSGNQVVLGEYDLVKGDNTLIIYLDTTATKNRMVKNCIFYFDSANYYLFTFSSCRYLIG